MNDIQKTLYIPLYGKAYVSRKGLFLQDQKAEEIWEREQFPLKGKSKSKWLAYYMGIRAAVFDAWVREQLALHSDCILLHLGCGLDSRVVRAGDGKHPWYDVDFDAVIGERSRHFQENDRYHMIPGDLRSDAFLQPIPTQGRAVVVMEGVSMYLKTEELAWLLQALAKHFQGVSLLMDCYTPLAARLSKIKNPIKDVGVHQVYGVDAPEALSCHGLSFRKEHDMTPPHFLSKLHGMEKTVFQHLYAGALPKKLYRLFEYTSE